MPSRLLLQELTREDARSIAADALLVFPVGATEQHGPHLPVGTDFLTVEHVTRAAAASISASVPVVVAPTLPFGSSHHHLPFGGTMSLSTETYFRVMVDLCESLIGDGFKRIFIVNGHGGNHELVQLAARDLALKHPVSMAAASYWTIAWDALIAAGAHEQGHLPGHSGIYETSQMMALFPDLVSKARPHRADAESTNPRGFAAPYRVETHGSWQQMDGFSDSPDLADAERGRRYLDAVIRSLAKAFGEFYAATTTGKAGR